MGAAASLGLMGRCRAGALPFGCDTHATRFAVIGLEAGISLTAEGCGMLVQGTQSGDVVRAEGSRGFGAIVQRVHGLVGQVDLVQSDKVTRFVCNGALNIKGGLPQIAVCGPIEELRIEHQIRLDDVVARHPDQRGREQGRLFAPVDAHDVDDVQAIDARGSAGVLALIGHGEPTVGVRPDLQTGAGSGQGLVSVQIGGQVSVDPVGYGLGLPGGSDGLVGQCQGREEGDHGRGTADRSRVLVTL